MRDGLKPEVRVNKNGVPVTKHVRDGNVTAGKRSMLSVIAPSLNKKLVDKAERRSLVNHFGEALSYWFRRTDRWGNMNGPERIESRRADLNKYSIENLRYVASLCDTTGHWEEQNRVMTILENRSGSEEWAMTGLRYRHLLGDPEDKAEFFKRLDLVERHFTDEQYLSHAEDGTEEFAFNVKVVNFALKAFHHIMNGGGVKHDYGNPRWSTPISTDLVNVLRDFPDREEDIFSFMRDRSLAPYMVSEEMLREYLDSPSVPLRSGTL